MCVGGVLLVTGASAGLVAGLGTRQVALLGGAAWLLLLGLLCGAIGSRATVAAAATGLTLMTLPLGWPDQVRFFLWTLTHDERPLGIHMHQPRYCYVHIPGSSVVHTRSEFSVTYSIDEQGFRVTPTPAQSQGRVTVLGCSFSFGHGVGDRQHYPHLLGQHHWPKHKVRNRAVMGWGTEHALLALEDELQERAAPRLVLYGWMREHIHRSGSPRHCRNTHSYYMDHPQPEEAIPRPAQALRRNAVKIQTMYRRCEARGVPFYAVLLSSPDVHPGQRQRREYAKMIATLRRMKVPLLDLSKVGQGMFYTMDHHPRSSWHRAVAAALGRALRPPSWAGDSRLTPESGRHR